MNDHNLDDLIIGDPEPGTKKSKTLLTIIALLIVILIAGLILWALLFSSTDETASSAPQTQAQPLDPSLIPLVPAPNNNESTATPEPAKKPASTKPKPKPQPKPASKPEPKPKPQPTQAPTPAPQQTTQQAPAPKAETPAPVTIPKNAELIKNANKTIYYVQVGAYKRDPSPKFMKKLKDGGFTFITKVTKGIRRVRVGPYDSYDEAKAALPVIKEKIGVDGLIVKF